MLRIYQGPSDLVSGAFGTLVLQILQILGPSSTDLIFKDRLKRSFKLSV